MSNRFFLLVITILWVGCNSPKNHPKKIKDEVRNSPIVKTEEKQSKKINTNTSLSQLVYSENEKRTENIGKLKHNSSTQKKTYSFKNEITGNNNEITLYYINKRIVRIEKRIWNNKDEKVQLGYSMYDFNDKNVCIANTERNYKEKMSHTNAMFDDSLIRYDVNCKIILIDKLQKAKIISAVKNSLDSVMEHFPEFEYNLGLK